MRFRPTRLDGATLIEMEKREDPRGFFARTFCEAEFAAAGLPIRFPQANLSGNARAGTLRGLHYQRAPHAEAKLVRCARGAIFDAIVDLRPASPSYRQWQGFTLDAASGTMLFVPEGFAHGYQTLHDDTEVAYGVTAPYAPAAEAGLRFDDAAFAIDWPLPVTEISDKDRSWAPFAPA